MILRIKRLIKTAIYKLGYDLRNTQGERGFYAPYLSRLCHPVTVFDVGVGYGTYELYQAFPEAKFFLIEPLKDYHTAIERIARDYDCKIYYKALGNKKGQQEINVDTNALHWSSFKKRSPLSETGNPLEKRQVEVTTLDTILKESLDIAIPILIKIDTEGFELEVLEGAKELLQMTDTVIAEVSVAKRFEGSYHFEDVILFMKENGFRVFDFLNIRPVKRDPGTQFLDIVFRNINRTE